MSISEAAKHAANVRYGRRHRDARTRALERFQVGDPCTRCGKPMFAAADIDLDHDDDDPTKYRGLAHSTCNRSVGGAKGGNTTAQRYFGKWAGPASLDVPMWPSVACTRCSNPRCWRGVGWNSRCW